MATDPTADVPRWIIDGAGDPCWDHDTGRDLSRFDLTGAWNTADDVPAAHRALVQCVRDADTLRRARELARTIRAETGDDQTLIPALLDLLHTQENTDGP